MQSMRILHTADLHLRNTEDDRWHALVNVLDQAEQLKAGALVVCGDMFDRSVDALVLKSELRELFEKRPFPVYILPGNHDGSGLSAGDFFGSNVTVMVEPCQTVDIGMLRIVALPFENVGPETVLERLLAAREKRNVDEGAVNVLLYHGELLDLIPDPEAFGEEEGHDYMPVRLSTFAGLGFDYVLAGHFHKSYDVRQYEGGYFVYPGSPVSVTRRETGRRHAVVVDAGEPPRPVPLETRHAENVEIVLNPFDRVGPAGTIQRRLEELDERAAVYLSIKGFADLDAMDTTEKEFDAEIRKFESNPAVVEVVAQWRDVGDILRNELFRKFNEHLGAEDVPENHRKRMREMVVDALTEIVYAD
jgi:DNA repair exonuclease SbcCD nuclease subunit